VICLVGRCREPIFEYTTAAWRSLVPDTTLMHEVLGHAEINWRDGCRMLVEQCYPELVITGEAGVRVQNP